MSPDQFRAKRSDATLNRQRILEAARAAFAATGPDTSMAEVARRSGLGSATLYRNFGTREELLEALFTDEIHELCAAAASVDGATAADRLEAWLRRCFDYATTMRPVVLGLLGHTGTKPAFHSRDRLLDRLLAAGGPLLAAAQDAHELDGKLEIGQVLDLVMAIARVTGTVDYKQPMLDAALAGIRRTAG